MWANKEGYFNEWWFYTLQAQAFDTAKPAAPQGAGHVR